MIQAFAQSSRLRTPRRAAVALLAVFLNVAMIPCSMAIEVVEEGHDCCPPELNLDTSDCCELADASVDARTGNFENDKPGNFETAPAPVDLPCGIAPIGHHVDATGPPPDPDTSPNLNKLFCVYLD